METPEQYVKSTIERRQGRRSGVFFNFEQISHIALLFSLLTSNKLMLGLEDS